MQDDHVRRDEFVLLDSNNLSDEHLLPHLGSELSGLDVIHLSLHLLILFLIILVPFPVLERILHHGRYYDEDQREKHGWFTSGDGNLGNTLHDRDQKEVTVRCLHELDH